eukprot:209261-Prymnesium_polylepis.1
MPFWAGESMCAERGGELTQQSLAPLRVVDMVRSVGWRLHGRAALCSCMLALPLRSGRVAWLKYIYLREDLLLEHEPR